MPRGDKHAYSSFFSFLDSSPNVCCGFSSEYTSIRFSSELLSLVKHNPDAAIGSTTNHFFTRECARSLQTIALRTSLAVKPGQSISAQYPIQKRFIRNSHLTGVHTQFKKIKVTVFVRCKNLPSSKHRHADIRV